MNFNELKEIAKKLGGILVMNGNSPEFVILPFENYRRMFSDKTVPEEQPEETASDEDMAMVDKLNKEILALKEEIRQREEAEMEESAEAAQ